MLVYAGIDEAGYGPMLGPLCVGASVFVLDDGDPEDGAPNLWRRLNAAVCRGRRDARHRIAVDDSKRLKGANSAKTHPLAHLERGVLAFLGSDGGMPEDDAALLHRVVGATPEAPWYASTTPLPVAGDAGQLRIAAARLRRAMERQAVQCAGLRCELIDAGPFNQQVERLGTKASVNFGAVLRLMDRIWRRWPDAHPRIVVDRQGGRTRYREDLQLAFPDADLRIVAETPKLSRYRLDRAGSALTVTFATEAETGHLPVALASMLAKLVRELCMIRLNRFFTGHLPELKPTAGYVTDARRYLQDIEPVVRRLDLPRPALVRSV